MIKYTQSNLCVLPFKKINPWLFHSNVWQNSLQKKKNLLRLQYNQEDFPCGSDGEESACNAGDPGSAPGSGRASGKRNRNPLRYSCLENPMDRGAWRVTVHRVTKSLTQLSDWHFSLSTIKTRYPAWYLYLCLSSRFYLEPQNYLLR